MAYCTRHCRAVREDAAPVIVNSVQFEGMSLLVIPVDGGTFSVLFACASNDSELRALLQELSWARVFALIGPVHAHVLRDVLRDVGTARRIDSPCGSRRRAR